MKRTLSFILAVMCAIQVFAQFEPNTRWPYLYENFTDGIIYFDGNKKTTAKLNIHLLGNKLHYVNTNGRIYESSHKDVIRVEIGSDAYLYSDRQMMKICTSKDKNVLLKLEYGNFDSMTAGSGAYGASLNSSAAVDLSSLDLGGLNKPELGKLLQEKNDGSSIPVSVKYYFVFDGVQVEASKKALDNYFGEAKESDWKAFLKANKIKWKNEDSLRKILDFIH